MAVESLLNIAGFLIAAGAVYGGIRSDLRAMHARQDRLEQALDKAHERIDGCVSCPSRRRGDK